MIRSPSEIHPALTDNRIDAIGHLIARVRAENLDSADGRDSGWSLGCRAYAWCCEEITQLAVSTSWLSIVSPPLEFIFSIGGVEISFYKGASDKPKRNISSRAQSHPELKQQSLGLKSPTKIPEKLVWAYAVETDLDGLTTGIEFFSMSESGDIVASRQVPIHRVEGAVISSILRPKPTAVAVPAATVSLPREKKPHTAETNDREGNV